MALSGNDLKEYIELTAESAANKAVEKITPRIRALENWRNYLAGAFVVLSFVVTVIMWVIK
jgi:hypothetical protein